MEAFGGWWPHYHNTADQYKRSSRWRRGTMKGSHRIAAKAKGKVRRVMQRESRKKNR